MKYLVEVFIIFFFLAPQLYDEIVALGAMITKKITEKRAKPIDYKIDEAFIKITAYNELYWKCKEESSNKEMPYMSVEEIEKIVSQLKSRKEK